MIRIELVRLDHRHKTRLMTEVTKTHQDTCGSSVRLDQGRSGNNVSRPEQIYQESKSPGRNPEPRGSRRASISAAMQCLVKQSGVLLSFGVGPSRYLNSHHTKTFNALSDPDALDVTQPTVEYPRRTTRALDNLQGFSLRVCG